MNLALTAKTPRTVPISPFEVGAEANSEVERLEEEESPLTINTSPHNDHEACGSSGAITRYYNNWEKITNNHFILRIIKEGYRIQFLSKPLQNFPVVSNTKSTEKINIIKNQIKTHINNGAISEVPFIEGQYVSRIFTVKKKKNVEKQTNNRFIPSKFLRH